MTRKMIRKAMLAIGAIALIVAAVTFTTWGFDPKSWEPSDRLMFAMVCIVALFFALFGPWEDD